MAAFVVVDPEASRDLGKEEYNIIHFQYSNENKIRKIPTSHIYKQTLFSRFNFLRRDKIKTVEGHASVDNCKDVYLLSRDDIRSHRSKYKFLHVELVQFSLVLSAVHSYGVNGKVSVSLRDSKYPNLQDSLLVSLESDVRQGAMKFYWFPNFSSPLFDLANSNALVVTIDPASSMSVNIRYTVYYKLMKKSPKPDYLFENPVLEVNTERTNVFVHKSNN